MPVFCSLAAEAAGDQVTPTRQNVKHFIHLAHWFGLVPYLKVHGR